MAVFTELGLTGYSIEDLLLQDARPRRGRGGGRHRRRGVRRPAAGARHRRAAAAPQPGLQLRGRHPPRPGARRRAEVVPAELPRVLRAPPDRPRRRPARRDPPRSAPTCRSARTCSSHAEDVPGPRRPRRGLRGHVGPDPAQRRGGARRRDGPAQPLRQPDHRRPGRGPQAPVPVGVLALPGRLRLRRRRPGRVDDRPVVGRPDDDLRERRPARRHRAVPARRADVGRPTSTWTCCARSACAWARSTTTGARTPHRTDAFRRIALHARPARRATSACAASSSASRSCPPTTTAWSRTATRPTTSRSRGCSSGCRRSAGRRSSSASPAAWTRPTR